MAERRGFDNLAMQLPSAAAQLSDAPQASSAGKGVQPLNDQGRYFQALQTLQNVPPDTLLRPFLDASCANTPGSARPEAETPGDAEPNPLWGYTSPADVLLDRVQLGLSMALPVSAESVRDFCSKLVQTGLLPRMPSSGKEIGQRLRIGLFPVPLSLGGTAPVGGQLILGRTKDGHLTITSASHLLPEVMRGLRTQLVDPGPLATDGDDNLVWSYTNRPNSPPTPTAYG